MNSYNTTRQTGSGCNRCGRRTTRSRLCRSCARSERHEGIAGGTSDDSTDDDEYVCVDCGAVFTPADGVDPCPDCGGYRHRRADAAGDLEVQG